MGSNRVHADDGAEQDVEINSTGRVVVWRRRRVEAELGAVGMVTRGAAQYALFRLRKYSRMQRCDAVAGDEPGCSAPHVDASTRHDARTACAVPSMSPPLRTPPQDAASPGAGWGHVSVQPLWCRVTQDGTPDGARRMLVSVEWHVTSREPEAPRATPPPGSPSGGTDRVVLVRVPPYPGIARPVGSFVVVDRPSFETRCSEPIHCQGHLRERPSGIPLSQSVRNPRRSTSRCSSVPAPIPVAVCERRRGAVVCPNDPSTSLF